MHVCRRNTDFTNKLFFQICRFENQAQTCEDIVEFEIQIPQIQIDDASPAGTSHHIQIEIQNGNGWQEPSDNVTYFVSDTTELNQTIDHTNHAVDKPIATFTPTGHLFLDNEHYFRPSEYCIQRYKKETNVKYYSCSI